MVTVQPGNTMELRGSLSAADHSKVDIFARTEEQLPSGLKIVSAEVRSDEQSVRIVLHNSSRRNVTIDSTVVLAELHSSNDATDIESLVGPSFETSCVLKDSVRAKCLIDSGSQVSILSESLFREHFDQDDLKPLEGLKVTGAGGHNIPYLGYVRTTVAFSSRVVGVDDCVDTMFLVCADTDYSMRVPVIIGTNTLKLLSNHCEQVAGRAFVHTHTLAEEVRFMYKDLRRDDTGRLGSAKLLGPEVVVPAGESVEVSCISRIGTLGTRDSVLVQEPTVKPLPEGVKVVACRVPASCLPRFKVILCNDSDHDIVLKKHQVVADVYVFSSTYDWKHVYDTLIQHDDDDVATGEQNNVHDSVHACSVDVDVDAGKIQTEKIEFKFGEETPVEWQTKFSQKLQSFQDVFVRSPFDITAADTEPVDIELEPGPAVRNRARPIPPQDFEDCRRHIQGLLDAQIIRPSNSPFASPIVLCRKKNGDLRLVCDYRAINSRTVRDSYAVPKIEDLFLTLSGAKWYTSMDLCKAYFQIPMTERAMKISAFVTPFGVFEWARLSQGLCNAPAQFQRILEGTFRDMNLVELIIFLDDLLVHGKTLEELEERTVKVLERLRKFKLKLDPAKCVFGATEIKHLGFVISENNIKPDPDKLSAVTSWPKPKTVREVKQFLGFAGVYRRFIPDYSAIAKPLNDLTKGYVPMKSRGSQKKKPGVLNLSSDITAAWGEKEDRAFDALKEALTSDLVLGIADRTRPFFLHTDASLTSLGAVLYQEFDGQMRVIAYASRGLNKSEQNYPAHKREFLALKWAMGEKFRDYLFGAKVTVVTDNNPLCYVLKNAKLDATCHRWLASLSLFDFDLRYKRGVTHVEADRLSRRRHSPPEEDEEYVKTMEKISFLMDKAKAFGDENDCMVVDQDSVQAIFQAHRVFRTVHSCGQTVGIGDEKQDSSESDLDEEFIPAVELLTKDPSLIPENILDPKEAVFDTVSHDEWVKIQGEDTNLRKVIRALKEGKELVASELDSQEFRVFCREKKKLFLRNEVLYRKVEEEEGVRWQLVIPSVLRKKALSGVHEDLFHTHFDDGVVQLRKRFFWPYMARDLEKKIRRCGRCVRKGASQQKAPMQSIVTTFPLELLSIDYLTIEVKGQKQNILVILDHFTKFATAVCTKDQTAKTVATVLWQKWFSVYGFCARILSDQGRDFESQLIKELCQLAGIQKCRTTPYHPSGNPVERYNRSLLNMIRSLEDDKKSDWRKSLPAIVHAYNCCNHQSTGFCPYFLFFGRHPRLPIDLAFGVDLNQSKKTKSTSQYVRDLKSRLSGAYQKAAEQMKKSRMRNKVRYDSSAHAAELESGDRVLVRRLGPRLDSKVTDKWEKDVYVVISKAEGLPVYTVQEERGSGPKRTLHRNYLLPIGVLDENCSEKLTSHREPVQNQDKTETKSKEKGAEFCEETIDQEFDIEITTEPKKLRVEAPVLIPQKVGTDEKQELEDVTDVQTVESGEVSGEVPDDGNSSCSTSSGDSELVDQNDEASGESADENPEHQTEKKELRRSTRPRKPVEKLNLMHSVSGKVDTQTQTVPVVCVCGKVEDFRPPDLSGAYLDEELVDCVMNQLSVLMETPLKKSRVVFIERILTGLMHV
ncbi:hypothetical protein V1264_017813 [Littorina saxatilis]|uniref:Reverse transcriptase n=1 Tax=Littorina saxatilis TaxID=31220 RepID=A0AAN9GG51_9CAEN